VKSAGKGITCDKHCCMDDDSISPPFFVINTNFLTAHSFTIINTNSITAHSFTLWCVPVAPTRHQPTGYRDADAGQVIPEHAKYLRVRGQAALHLYRTAATCYQGTSSLNFSRFMESWSAKKEDNEHCSMPEQNLHWSLEQLQKFPK
jgi:hypothetical protein